MSEESMNSLEDLLDQHDYELPELGDIRMGVIVANTPQGMIIDLGLKRDGIVPQSDLAKLEPEEREALKINDEVPVYIAQTDDPETLVVSIHLARLNQDWIEAEALLTSGQIFEGEVIGYNKGGVIVPYGRIRGFVPISHLSDVTPGMGERRRQQRLARLRGESIGVKIIEVDRHRHRLVMSQREAQKEWEEKKRGELMETLQPGEIRTGRISGMREFGAFVDLGGADGLVHISELSWHRIDHPREVVKLGDEIEVYVLGVDQDSGRISLSRKKLLPNPWDTVTQRYTQNELIEGKVTRILDYGAFAEIEPGVEGLLHISQLSRNAVEDPRAVVKEGEVHLLRIVSIDQKRQRIGLSLKAVTTTEQIEWMAQKELADALRREEEEAAEAARVPTHHAAPAPAAEPAPADESVAEAQAAAAMPVVEEAPAMAEAAPPAVEDTAVAEEPALSQAAVEAAPETDNDTAEEAAELAAGDIAFVEPVETVETVVEADDAADAVAETAEAAVDAGHEVVADTAELVDDGADAVTDTVENAADAVEETAEAVVDEGREAVADAADFVDDGADAAADTVDDAADAVEETAEAAVDAGREAVADAADLVEDGVDAVADSAESLTETVQDAAAAAVDAVKNVFGSVVDRIEAALTDDDNNPAEIAEESQE
ncbi:RNA binding S1 domain protein (modular protein) [Candidatus Promineifilum breve]|uniref:RNA binding S1 domain protein (Modular protein) n=1 Tax=Candidatus Promineifilum breve TaxID=1806508 RepID=A0A170PEX2_9CHLR|nr:S1 RNA-binding domain-containing protein [Candidatus Promineifilum breve]CUS02837.2 RNA binding S1 domain protein (modular protein) [Candidatus Promineifilum breve]